MSVKHCSNGRKANLLEGPGPTAGSKASERDLPASPPSEKTLLEMADFYFEQQKKAGKKSWKDNESLTRLYISTSSLASKPANLVTTGDIVRLLKPILQKAPRQAGKLQALLNAAYNIALKAAQELDATIPEGWDEFNTKSNPVAITTKIGRSGAGDRNLNDRELGLFWCHLTESSASITPVYKFLKINVLLAGQRCEQLIECRLDAINDFERSLLQLDGKGKKPNGPDKHVLPLSEKVWPLIEEQRAFSRANGSTYLFAGRTTGTHMSSDSISKKVTEISKILGETNFGDTDPFPPFSYMDIRRTAESRLADLGVTNEDRGLLLSHGLGGVQKKHYNRSKQLKQKRAALVIWEEYLFRVADTQLEIYRSAIKTR